MTEDAVGGIAVVHYREGYRYQLTKAHEQDVSVDGIFPVKPGGNEFVHLSLGGDLYIAKHYAWNGADRPAINDKMFVRPSLVHDAHIQLWHLKIIDDAGRAAADRLLARMLRIDGLIIARRQKLLPRLLITAVAYVRPLWVEGFVSWYSKHYAVIQEEPILTAP